MMQTYRSTVGLTQANTWTMKVSQILYRFLLRPLTHRWPVKLNVLILAAMLWVFVAGNQTYEVEMPVEINPVKTRPGKVVISEIPRYATARVSGTGKDLVVLKYIQHPVLELDLHTIREYYNYPLKTEFVITPPGMNVRVESILEPDTVYVRLGNRVSKRVPVEPQVTVQPKMGYTLLQDIEVVPDSVTVSGPTDLMRSIQAISTEERTFVDVHKRMVEDEVPLELPEDDALSVEPKIVLVRLHLDRIAEHTMERIPVGAVRVPLGRRASVEPSRIDVILQGPASKLAALEQDSIDAFVNMTQWSGDQKMYSPRIRLPDRIELVRTIPDKVRVRMEVSGD
ncbi:hypothetical protein GF324_06070 [bacterium]|nr:hypothetical protein [bacterium]